MCIRDSSSVDSSSIQVLQHETFSEAAMCGIRVAIKWVTRIFAPLVLLGFVAIVALILYHGINEGDWSLILDPDDRWLLAQMLAMLPLVYMVPCFWASLFACMIYCVRHAVSSRRPKKTDA